MNKHYGSFCIVIVFLMIFGVRVYPANAQEGKIYRDIGYISSAGEKQKLDIHIPPVTSNKTMLPVIIFVHGGGWSIGDKKTVSRKDVVPYMKEGIIVVSVNYRLSPEYMHPAHVNDIAAAIKWVFENISSYGGDKNNMLLIGHSAGAHLVALLGTNPNYLQKQGLGTDIFKAILPDDTATFDLTHKQEGLFARRIQKMRDNAFGTELEVLIEASPLLQVRENLKYSPFIIFATAKRADAVEQSKLFASELVKKGHKAKAIVIDENYSHADMKRAIFNPETKIYSEIINTLK